MRSMCRKRGGFTLIEMLMVISVMAILATLTTGSAIKLLQSSRNRRADTTARALDTALQNYRAAHNKWPFNLSDFEVKPNTGNNEMFYRCKGDNNHRIFKELYPKRGGGGGYVDTSSILVRVGGKRMSLRQALERGQRDAPIGYPDPKRPSTFHFFSVRYNSQTDEVKVYRDE